MITTKQKTENINIEDKFVPEYVKLFERIYEEATGHSPKEELKQ